MKTVFVSSTFKDMHLERDAIREITAPLLNDEARKHGDEFDFCDLRWGINTGDLDTDEGSKKVLDVCLDEIDRCEPPMVVLLGYRYGWIPDANLIKKAVAEREGFKINVNDIEDLKKSVTALEIEYGALRDETKFANTLFYFREIEGNVSSDYLAEDDDEHKRKISELKNRIKGMTGGRVKYYTLKWNGSGFDGVYAFAKMLAEDIKSMLMPEWEKIENLTPFERERRTHNTFIQEKNIMFRARQTEAEKLVSAALSQPVTIIKGEVGSGKSTLFSHMAAELEKTEWTVLPFISGLTMESNSAADIIENTVYFIEEELHLDHYIEEEDPWAENISPAIEKNDFQTGTGKKHTRDEWRNRLAEMCAAYTKTGRKLLIMLDAADQLAPGEERDKLHFIPASVSENIHFVMTCTMDFKTSGWEYYSLQQLNDKDKLDVIRGTLGRNGRELSEPVIKEMLKLKASDNPLYLSLLAQRLLMMNSDDFMDIRSRGDGMTAIEQHQLMLIKDRCPDDLDAMSAAILNEAGKRINEELVSKAAEYLAVTRNGLRKKDLAALLGENWADIDFSHFVNYMNDCFMQRDDGRYDFTHKSIREGFRRQCKDPSRINRDILEYLKSLDTDDPVRMREIIYHTIQTDDKNFFVEYIIKYKYHDNRLCINYAALDVYAQCIADNGQWMMDVLNDAKKHTDDENLINLNYFCNYDLNDVFSGSQKELEIGLSILSVNTYFLEHLYHKIETNECKRALFVSYDSLAGIHEKLGSRKNLEQALELYDKGLEISRQLTKELGTVESKRDYSLSCNNIARIYEKFGSRENLEQALKQYQKSHEIRKQLTDEVNTPQSKRDLLISYISAIVIYSKLGNMENLEQALKLGQKSQEIGEYLAKKLNTADSKRDLTLSYEYTAVIYKKLGSRESLKQALELYNKGLAIREQLTKEIDTAISKRDLFISYINIAEIYEKLGSREDLERALKLHDKGLAISRQLAKELGTAESKRDLVLSYVNIAEIYGKLGGREDLERALEMYDKGLTISRKLAKELGTAESKRDLSTSYNKIAEIYKKLGSRKDLKRALKLYDKGLAIREQLVKELGTADSKRELATNYGNAAGIYEMFGGKKNLERALELYGKGLAISRQLVKELGTADSKRELAVDYHNTARIYAELGGRKNLEQALELCHKSLAISRKLAKELDTAKSKRELASSYNNIAIIYKKLGGGDNLERALELCHKGLATREQLVKKLGTAESKSDLASSYNNAAGIYAELGGRKNLEQALELCHKSLAISELLAKTLDTPESKRSLAFSYDRAARIYADLGGRDNLERALELCHKGLTINELLANTLDTADSKSDLAFGYNKAAGIYAKLGGRKNLERALKLCHKGLTTRELLAKKLDTMDSKWNLAASYNNIAVIYKKLGGRENLVQALELYDKSLVIWEQLANELGTADSKRKLAGSYINAAGIYKELGGREDLEQALEFYNKALVIREQLANELDTAESKGKLALSYVSVAEIYKKLDGRENLERALILHNKALEISEQLANTLKTIDVYNILWISLYSIATHPSTTISDKKNLLNRVLNILKVMYEQTNMDKYKTYIDTLTEELIQLQ